MSGIWKNATLWRNDHELGVLLMIWSRFKLDVLHYWCFLMHRPSLKYKNKHKSYLSELHGKVASHLLHVWGAFLPLFCVLLQLCSKRCHLSSVHLKGLRFPYKWLLCSSSGINCQTTDQQQQLICCAPAPAVSQSVRVDFVCSHCLFYSLLKCGTPAFSLWGSAATVVGR